jgi:hypothetical protein
MKKTIRKSYTKQTKKTRKNKKTSKNKKTRKNKKNKYDGGMFSAVAKNVTKNVRNSPVTSLLSRSIASNTGSTVSNTASMANPLIDNLNKTTSKDIADQMNHKYNTIGSPIGPKIIGKSNDGMPDFTKLYNKVMNKNDELNDLTREMYMSEFKKMYNKTANTYDEWTDPTHHIPMNEYGRYPSMFSKTKPTRPGEIEPFINLGEESWKESKQKRGWENTFKQRARNDIDKLYKKDDDKDKDKDKDDKDKDKDKDDKDKDEKYDEEVTTSSPPVLTGLDENIASQIYDDTQKKYYDEFKNIELKEKVIKENNKIDENNGFIGWTNAAKIAGFTNYTPELLNNVVKSTAISMAKIKTKIVNLSYETGSAAFKLGRNIAYAAPYVLRTGPLSVKTLYGAVSMGTIKSITAIVQMSYSDTDWSKKENLDEWYKQLGITLDGTLNILFDDLIKQGCGVAIPRIFKQIIHEDTVDSIGNILEEEKKINKSVGELLDSTNVYCNKIIPAISEYLHKNGFDGGIGEEAKKMLIEYNSKALELLKKILFDIVSEKLNNTPYISKDPKLLKLGLHNEDIEIISDTPEFKEEFEEFFNKITITSIITSIMDQAEIVHENITKNYDKYKVKEAIKLLKNDRSKTISDIEAIEGKIKANIINPDKIAVSEFVTNIQGSLFKLIKLWNKSIYDIGFSNKNDSLGCLLNILDIRLETLIRDSCVLAGNKLPEQFCTEKVAKIAELWYNNEIDVTDIIDIFKQMVNNALIDSINQTLIDVSDEFKNYSYLQQNIALQQMLFV